MMAESFQLCPMRLDWLKTLGISSVIDVGAHAGEFATHISSLLPEAAIFSFEPLSGVYELLEMNMRRSPHFHGFRFALGERKGTRTIFRNGFTPSSSLLSMSSMHREAFPFTEREYPERIEVRRLDDVMRSHALEDRILIKVDVQGFENRVILGGKKTISKAHVIILETSMVPLYEHQPLFGDIFQLMTSLGFQYRGNASQLISPVDGTVLQADAIFFNTTGSSPKLRKVRRRAS